MYKYCWLRTSNSIQCITYHKIRFANNSLQFNLAYLPGFHWFFGIQLKYSTWMWMTCLCVCVCACVCTRNGIKSKFELSIDFAIAFYFGLGFNVNVILLLALKWKHASNSVHRVSTCINEISSWIVNCISVDSTPSVWIVFFLGFPSKFQSSFHYNTWTFLLCLWFQTLSMMIFIAIRNIRIHNSHRFEIRIDTWFLLLFCMRGLWLPTNGIANLWFFFWFQ